MRRCCIQEREHWKSRAEEFGFKFHTMHGEPYWDESAYYQFSLQQIEQHIEEPTKEIHQMCLSLVETVVHSEYWLKQFCIPESHWEWILDSWKQKEPSLYSRLDLAYNGKDAAKLYENNADTPTSVYETGFWQWLWLEDGIASHQLPSHADQFNALQDQIVNQWASMHQHNPHDVLYFSCCKESEEDRGTVQYLEDCAKEAGITTKFVYIEDIGCSQEGFFTDLDHHVITWMFKLYPWEFMMREKYSQFLHSAQVRWVEPSWKAILSNKALLPMLWRLFPNHPNLLEAYFEHDAHRHSLSQYVKKPIFAREGANIQIYKDTKTIESSDGPYGEEGYIYQAYYPLPKFNDNFALIGSWLVNDQPAGISVREDTQLITQDLSRYLPHIILD